MCLLVLFPDLGLLRVGLLVLVPAWVCGSVVGGVAGVGVLVVLPAWCVDVGKFGVLKKKYKKELF